MSYVNLHVLCLKGIGFRIYIASYFFDFKLEEEIPTSPVFV